MFRIHYDLEGVKGSEAYAGTHVDTLEEALVIAEAGCCYRLSVTCVMLVYLVHGDYAVMMGNAQVGTVRIRVGSLVL